MKRNYFDLLAIALATMVTLAVSVPVHAYGWKTYNDHPIRWKNKNVTLSVNTISFPPNNPYTVAFARAVNNWNSVGGSSFRFYTTTNSNATSRPGNGLNEVYFCNNCTDPDQIASTYKHWVSYYYVEDWGVHWRAKYVETDIKFDTAYSWTSYTWRGSNLADSIHEFEGVAIHELGHALGLNHEDRLVATMNSAVPNGGFMGNAAAWLPLGDDRRGVRYLYGNGGTETDVSPLRIRDAGVDSKGNRVGVDLAVWPTTVSRGATLNSQFAFTNLGTSRITFGVCWMLTGGPSGTVNVGSNTGAWGDSGFTGYFTKTLIVPTWIQPGNYQLMFRVDCFNENVEHYEGNYNDMTILTWIRVL